MNMVPGILGHVFIHGLEIIDNLFYGPDQSGFHADRFLVEVIHVQGGGCLTMHMRLVDLFGRRARKAE